METISTACEMDTASPSPGPSPLADFSETEDSGKLLISTSIRIAFIAVSCGFGVLLVVAMAVKLRGALHRKASERILRHGGDDEERTEEVDCVQRDSEHDLAPQSVASELVANEIVVPAEVHPSSGTYRGCQEELQQELHIVDVIRREASSFTSALLVTSSSDFSSLSRDSSRETMETATIYTLTLTAMPETHA